jgi:hypothetical protein
VGVKLFDTKTAAANSIATVAVVNAIDDIVDILNDHFHQDQLVWPNDTTNVTLSDGGAPNTFGPYVEMIPAGGMTTLFDIHWVDVSNPSQNAVFLVEFYHGDSDTPMGRIKFTRLSAQSRSFQIHMQAARAPAGDRCRARLMTSVGGATVDISIFNHMYP